MTSSSSDVDCRQTAEDKLAGVESENAGLPSPVSVLPEALEEPPDCKTNTIIKLLRPTEVSEASHLTGHLVPVVAGW